MTLWEYVGTPESGGTVSVTVECDERPAETMTAQRGVEPAVSLRLVGEYVPISYDDEGEPCPCCGIPFGAAGY